MHSTTIGLVVLSVFATMAMARPGRRPWSGHHQYESTENEIPDGRAYRVPDYIRLPGFLDGKLGEPISTFTKQKIMNGKYLLLSPALMFKIKGIDTESSTTVVPEVSTTVAGEEESTTVAVDEDTTVDSESEEATTAVPSFLESRSFSFDDDDDDDDEQFSSLDD